MLDSVGRHSLGATTLEFPEIFDGRRARGERTRHHIVKAFLQLLRTDGPGLTIADVADLAGCSRRSIFAHFAAISDLRRAAADHLLEQGEFTLSLEDRRGPMLSRLRREMLRRERECAAWWPLWRALQAASPDEAELVSRFGTLRQRRETRGAEVFADELAGANRRQRRAFDIQLGTLTSIEAWVTLRDHYQFTAPAIRQHWCRSLVRMMPREAQQAA